MQAGEDTHQQTVAPNAKATHKSPVLALNRPKNVAFGISPCQRPKILTPLPRASVALQQKTIEIHRSSIALHHTSIAFCCASIALRQILTAFCRASIAICKYLQLYVVYQ